MKKTEKKAEKTAKKTMKTSEAVSLYNILRGLKIGKLPKEGQFRVIRAARAMKPAATAFEDFVADARERLKPEGFDAALEKRRDFDNLSEEEKREINETVSKFNKDIDDCVHVELDKAVEVDPVEPLGEDALALLAEANDLDVQTVMLLEEL